VTEISGHQIAQDIKDKEIGAVLDPKNEHVLEERPIELLQQRRNALIKAGSQDNFRPLKRLQEDRRGLEAEPPDNASRLKRITNGGRCWSWPRGSTTTREGTLPVF
jgi:hypothetical protein